ADSDCPHHAQFFDLYDWFRGSVRSIKNRKSFGSSEFRALPLDSGEDMTRRVEYCKPAFSTVVWGVAKINRTGRNFSTCTIDLACLLEGKRDFPSSYPC